MKEVTTQFHACLRENLRVSIKVSEQNQRQILSGARRTLPKEKKKVDKKAG